MTYTCGNCLFHLPDAEEWVCANEDSSLHGSFTGDDDSCVDFMCRKDAGEGPEESVASE